MPRENTQKKFVSYKPVLLVADDAQGSGNSIPANAKVAVVTGVTNGTNDFIVLPSVASCPIGHEIVILNSASSNFELRTPSASAEEINSEDCDGTKELLMTDTQIVRVVKISDSIGWMAEGRTAIGAYATAVVPDA
jgi:hypothetical protein